MRLNLKSDLPLWVYHFKWHYLNAARKAGDSLHNGAFRETFEELKKKCLTKKSNKKDLYTINSNLHC